MVTIQIENMTRLASIHNLIVFKFESRTYLVHVMSNDRDAVVEESESTIPGRILNCRLDFEINWISALEVSNVVVKQAPVQCTVRITDELEVLRRRDDADVSLLNASN